MSKKDLEKAFNLIEQNFNDDEMDFGGPQSIEIINKAEDILNVKFPHTYKLFLEKYGCGGVGSLEVYGLTTDNNFFQKDLPFITVPNAVWTTIKRHQKFNHPLNLIIIYEVGEGSMYCLDTSQMNSEGECPVVVWPVGGYEATPKLEVVAEDFGKFFLDKVQEEIEEKLQD